MHFLWVNVAFYAIVIVICDVITTADPIPYTAKFLFDVRITKLNKSDVER